MADPNGPAIGGNTGTLAAPDQSSLVSDLDSINATYEPKVQAEEAEAESYSQRAVGAEEQSFDEAEVAARELTADDQEMQQWLDSTPTRQASYAASMHAAPLLSILTALGGKVTRLNGQQMLAATTGIVQGLNSASEKNYEAAYKAWQAAYEKMKVHQQRLADAHRMMLTAYQGRADAYQKASEAARRMTGDILDDKQRALAQRTDLFKAQQAAFDKLQRVNLSREALHERIQKDIAQESHWKVNEQKASNADPALKSALAQEKTRWTNAKAKYDENLKRRGQISSNLSMSEDVKAEELKKIDDENEALAMEMDRAISNGDAAVAGAAAARASGPAAPARPGSGPAPAPGASRA